MIGGLHTPHQHNYTSCMGAKGHLGIYDNDTDFTAEKCQIIRSCRTQIAHSCCNPAREHHPAGPARIASNP